MKTSPSHTMLYRGRRGQGAALDPVPLMRKVAQPLLRPRPPFPSPFAKVRSFSCAPWKRVRIFEENIGIFQDAHFSNPVRIFEGGAHLRTRAPPWTPCR